MMNWLEMERRPEPELMDAKDEVCAYASAASQRHLDDLDNSFVSQAIAKGSRHGALTGRLLDVGCGPGGIALKIARRCPALAILGIDSAANMVQAARRAAVEAGLEERVTFQQANGGQLPFSSCTFDIVLSNSVLHHLSKPSKVLEEMLRVTKADGMVLVRDLRRPSRLAYPLHVRWYGRHYSGIMRRLFENSVSAAYTPDELADMLGRSGMSTADIFLHDRSHMGFIYRGQQR